MSLDYDFDVYLQKKTIFRSKKIENGGPDQKSAILGYFDSFFGRSKSFLSTFKFECICFLDVKLTKDYDSGVILLK